MFFDKYFYLIGATYALSFWLIFFAVQNEHSRKKMLLLSLFGLVVGHLVQNMHLIDWWSPPYIFPLLRLEDMIFGFSTAGVASSVYSIIRNGFRSKGSPLAFRYKIIISLASCILLFGLFYFFHIHSFWSSSIATIFVIVSIVIQRRESLWKIFIVGLFLVILAIPWYFLGVFVDPGWIERYWFVQQFSGINILSIPIEEFFWFFLAGSVIAAFQELWQ